jgi:hypothetical protein
MSSYHYSRKARACVEQSAWPRTRPGTHVSNAHSYLSGYPTTKFWSGTCPTQLTHQPGVHPRHSGTSRGSFHLDNRHDRRNLRVEDPTPPPDSLSSTYTGLYEVGHDVILTHTYSSRRTTCYDDWQPDLSQHCLSSFELRKDTHCSTDCLTQSPTGPEPYLNGSAQPIRPFDRYGNPPSCQEDFSEYSNTHGASEPRPLHLQDSPKVQAAEKPASALLQLEARWRA